MVKVKEYKYPQHNTASERFFSAERLCLPLSQHTGKPSLACVKPGDTVKTGDVLAYEDGLISARLHAPSGGKVLNIEDYFHPVLRTAQCITVRCQPQEKIFSSRDNVDALSGSQLREIIRDGGIVGMGGACFPAHVKLSPSKKINTLIINGCECEPYLACDDRLMVENLEGIFAGIAVLAKILSPEKVIIAVEENKPQAVKLASRLISAKKYDFPVLPLVVLKSLYPQGAEKQLIYKVTRRKVPAGGLPFDVACLVHNVATAFAVYEAVYYGKPLIERMVTFAGGALKNPKNLWLKIGTTIKEIFDKGVLEFNQPPDKIVHGGPMMGLALDGVEYPILKGTSGVLFLTESEVDSSFESPCIRCARCVDNCPMNLFPLEYVKRVKRDEFSSLADFYINDCIECGCCAYVCPAKIPLVHYIKIGKKYAVDR
ncbi:MAG: electron transport complex subunit RsxC [Candidatus Omnitrophota bacterium]